MEQLPSFRILIVEPETDILSQMTGLLRSHGHRVTTAMDGVAGFQRAQMEAFDLILLNIALPKLNGLEICHALRQRGFDGGVRMLTAKNRVADCIKGLRAGADDYIARPTDPEELLARVEALLRRTHGRNLTPVTRIEFDGVVADFSKPEFFKRKKVVNLSPKETELLRYLVNNRGQRLKRDAILQQVWKDQQFITGRTVDVHIAWLRQKLEDDPKNPKHILTVCGEGYQFQG